MRDDGCHVAATPDVMAWCFATLHARMVLTRPGNLFCKVRWMADIQAAYACNVALWPKLVKRAAGLASMEWRQLMNPRPKRTSGSSVL
jgi:hypothetical protein